MTSKAKQMADEIGGFLLVAEKATKRDRQERQLQRKMTGLFESAYAQAIAAVEEDGRLSNPTRIKAMSSLGLDTEKKLGDLVWQFNKDALAIDPTTQQKVKEHTFKAASSLTKRKRARMESLLAGAYQEGASVDTAVKLLRAEYVDLKDHQLRSIAQTEFTRTANAVQYEEHLSRGIRYHQWLTVMDGNARTSHQRINTQITRTGARFSNGLRFPGDTSGPIEEWINCRCSLSPWFLPIGKRPPGFAAKGQEEIVFAVKEIWFYERDLVDLGRKVEQPSIPKPERTKKISREAYLKDIGPENSQKLTTTVEEWSESDFRFIRAHQLDAVSDIDPYWKSDFSLTKVEGQIDALDDMFDNVKPYKGEVWRGMNVSRDDLDAIIGSTKKGSEITFDSFTSTSQGREVAERFTSIGDFDDSVMFRIKSKSGIDISPFTEAGQVEKEVLFQSGSRFKVIAVEKQDTTDLYYSRRIRLHEEGKKSYQFNVILEEV